MAIISASIWFFSKNENAPVFNDQNSAEMREIHLITVEYKSKTDDGKIIEAYRWDPGTIFVNKGEKVKLRLFGVNGHEHAFMIEGTKIEGTVKKGEETIVPVQFDKEGVFKLVCLTHHDENNHVPMVANIVVD